MTHQSYSCSEHVDILIEEYVNDYELAPELDVIGINTAFCSWCGQKAVYTISRFGTDEDPCHIAD